MFDLRYHLASLAAVFVAIAVGIVIGVAIASGGGVDDATKAVQEDTIRELESRLQSAEDRADRSEGQEEAIADLMGEVYPALMADRLDGKRLVLLFLGPVDGGVRSAVERTLTDAGAGNPERVAALAFPIDVEELDGILASDPAFEEYRGDARLGALGEALASELVVGGETPLWDALAGALVEARTGGLELPADGVVVVRSWLPEEGDEVDPVEEGRANQTEALIAGLVKGLSDEGVPVVGVEASTADPSTIDLYRSLGVSSVDDVDRLPGRVALGLLLAGADGGHYGVKESADDGVAPPLDPLPVFPAATVAG
jgi:hypothetical protein